MLLSTKGDNKQKLSTSVSIFISIASIDLTTTLTEDVHFTIEVEYVVW